VSAIIENRDDVDAINVCTMSAVNCVCMQEIGLLCFISRLEVFLHQSYLHSQRNDLAHQAHSHLRADPSGINSQSSR